MVSVKRVRYPKILKCPIDGCEFTDCRLKRLNRIIVHLSHVHQLTGVEAYTRYHGLTNECLCECGCGELIEWRGWNFGFPRFKHGHNGSLLRGEDHWTHASEHQQTVKTSRLKASQTLKERGGRHYKTLETRASRFVNKSLTKFGPDRFSYVRVPSTYVSSAESVQLQCSTCQVWFETTPYIHLHTSNGGCRQCFVAAVSIDVYEYQTRIKRVHGESITWLNPRKISDVHQHESFKCNRCNKIFTKTFNNLISKRYGCPFHISSTSKGQLELHARLLELDTSFAPPEQTIHFKDGGYCVVDCLLPSKKFVVEFYGTWWHADPRFYKSDVLIGASYRTLAKDKWRSDDVRTKKLEAEGYKVIIVWQHDWEQDPTTALEFIKMELAKRG